MFVSGAARGKNNKILFCDYGTVKKEEHERRKKLRLEQVRCFHSNQMTHILLFCPFSIVNSP